MKGFGKIEKNPRYLSILKQIETLIAKQKSLNDSHIPIFGTSLKKKKILSLVVNDIAPRFPEYYFNCLFVDEACPGVIIVPAKSLEKTFSYVWLEISKISGKWLVMAKPPGAWQTLCICVWKNEEQAKEMAHQIYDAILKMPIDDWTERKGKFRELIESLPRDDDSIISVLNHETGQTVKLDLDTQEYLSGLQDKALQGDQEAWEQLMVTLKVLT